MAMVFLRPLLRPSSLRLLVSSPPVCAVVGQRCEIAHFSENCSFYSSGPRNPLRNSNKLEFGLDNGNVYTQIKRSYGGKPPYSLKTVEDRVMLVLQLYDKIKPEKLALDSHFINDLGLDSLDHVEIMLQLEHEFTMEIPDADAEELMTPRKIAQYICDAEDVYE